MKSLLRLVGWLFIGLLFGIAIAMVISALVDGTSPIDEVKAIFDKGFLPKLVSILWMPLGLLIAYLLHIAIHEGGHLVAGLLTA